MPEDPVLEVTKVQKALQALLRELENLKAEVGKYSAASRSLEPAAEAVRSASGALSATSERFTDYAKTIAATDLASVSESLRAITAEVGEVRSTLEAAQKQLAMSTESVSKLNETVLTRERLVGELSSLHQRLQTAETAADAREAKVAGIVLAQSTAITAASTVAHGQTRNAIETSTATVQADMRGIEKAHTTKLDDVLAQLQAVQAANGGLRVIGIVVALFALAAAVFAYLGWHR